MIAFDIETVPDEERIKSRQWEEYKEKKQVDDDYAALLPAFGRVVCVCAYDNESKKKLSICTDNEHEILSEFLVFAGNREAIYGGHYIKGFDIPFMANRYVANGLMVPMPMRVADKKPWEIPHIDTVDLLKFGGGERISLDAACLMFGIPSPKEGEVKGNTVWPAYKEKQFSHIAEYCGRDVNAWLKLYKTLNRSGVC